MKIVLVSDSHGKDESLRKILELHPNADYYIHCGDVESRPIEPYLYVRGNNDYSDEFPESRIIKTSIVNIFVTHSHLFSYRKRKDEMAQFALKNDCRLVFYGHSHTPSDETIDGVRLINPGSLYYNRDGSEPCYCTLDIDNEGHIDLQYHTLPEEKKQRKFHFM